MFITSKKKYLSNDMRIFGTCSIPLISDHHVKNKNYEPDHEQIVQD